LDDIQKGVGTIKKGRLVTLQMHVIGLYLQKMGKEKEGKF
jgi:hypothetical protein